MAYLQGLQNIEDKEDLPSRCIVLSSSARCMKPGTFTQAGQFAKSFWQHYLQSQSGAGTPGAGSAAAAAASASQSASAAAAAANGAGATGEI